MDGLKKFKTDDAHSYDGMIENFDSFTDQFSHYAVDEILACIRSDGRGELLDIGCGSGVVTLAAAKAFGPSSRITGLDLSSEMLAFAGQKAERAGLADRIRFVEGDAEALPFADAAFDSVVSLYAWRHLPNPAAATREAFRVLRPGGTFVLAVGSGPELMSLEGVRAALAAPWRMLALKRGMELTACGHLDALIEQYLPRAKQAEVAEWTVGHHSFSGSLEGLLSGAGFTVSHSRWAGRSYVIDQPEDYWRLQATFSTIARKRIADAAPDQVADLKAEFRKQCDAVQSRGGKLMYRVGAMIFTAVRA